MLSMLINFLAYALCGLLIAGIVIGCAAFVLAADYIRIKDAQRAKGGAGHA